MENENNVALILSVITFLVVFLLLFFVLYQESDRSTQNSMNLEKIDNLEKSLQQQNSDLISLQDQINAMQITMNRLNTNSANYGSNLISLNEDISEVDYCSRRYNDQEDFEDFTTCIRRRLE